MESGLFPDSKVKNTKGERHLRLNDFMFILDLLKENNEYNEIAKDFVHNNASIGTVLETAKAKMDAAQEEIKEKDPKTYLLFQKNQITKDIYFNTYIKRCVGFTMLHKWLEYKKIYAIDADFYKDLRSTESVKVDFSIFSRLPFKSFYIDLTNIPLMSTSHFNEVVGVLVNIESDELNISIIDANNLKYNPQTIVEQVGEDLADNVFNKGTYKFTNVSVKDSDMAPQISHVSVFEDMGISLSTFDSVVSVTEYNSPVFKELIIFTMHFLMFLSSKTKDIVKDDIYRVHKSYGKELKEVEKWNVGFYYGEKIRSIEKRKQIYEDALATIERKNRPRPHIRCAHWHNYWCGSRANKYLELKWIEPTYCNGSLEDIIISINPVSDKENLSTGEDLIAQYLTKMNVPFDREYTVNIKNHNRRYDFLVHFKGKDLLIEFDGEQHFKPVEMFGGEAEFKARQIADWDKNKFAKQQKIPLLRIRYDQLGIIPSLIDKFLEHPSTSRFNPMIDNTKYYK